MTSASRNPSRGSKKSRNQILSQSCGRVGQFFEILESRTLMSVTTFYPTFKLLTSGGNTPDASTANATGTAPATMRHAYGVDAVTFGAVTGDAAGETIAIVDAYDEPNIASDLAAFDSHFGIAAPPSFTRLNENGGTSLPRADSRGGWGVETALDVEWAHVIAPKAKILLVEATSSFDSDLYAAVDTARKASGVVVVSMSWGGDEAASDSANDSHFLTPANHPGVTFVASSGDDGANSDTGANKKIVGYPAVSPNVLGVGGTTLSAPGGNYGGETAWSGSGGGVSKFFSKPSYQSGVTQSASFRTVPDVSFDADPNSGVPVYDTYDDGAARPWLQVGGTSLAAPMWAGVIAIADEGRSINLLGSLDGRNDTLPKIYSLPSTDFHDITSGSNGYSASSGYDLVTGRGTPIVNRVVTDLAGTPAPSTPVIGSFTANPSSVVVGTSTQLTASGVTENGGTIANVAFYEEVTNPANGLQIGTDTFLGYGSLNAGVYTLPFSTTGLNLGTYTFYAVATDTNSVPSAVSTTQLSVTGVVTTITSINGTVLSWNTNGQSSYGSQGLAASTVATGAANSTGLTRGPGVLTNSAAPSANAWGGNGWANTSAAGVSGGQYITFGFTIAPGYATSLSSISMNYSRSNDGPNNGFWQYQLNGGAWATIGTVNNEFRPVKVGSGAAITPINLASISALQSLAAGSVVNFRLTPFQTNKTTGTLYVYDGGQNTNDLVVTAAASGPTVLNHVAPPSAVAFNFPAISSGSNSVSWLFDDAKKDDSVLN